MFNTVFMFPSFPFSIPYFHFSQFSIPDTIQINQSIMYLASLEDHRPAALREALRRREPRRLAVRQRRPRLRLRWAGLPGGPHGCFLIRTLAEPTNVCQLFLQLLAGSFSAVSKTMLKSKFVCGFQYFSRSTSTRFAHFRTTPNSTFFEKICLKK